MDWFINRCRGQSIWKDISVVRFLPLSFYAKKKVAERKARIRGIAPRSASLRSALLAAARVKFCCYCRILRQCKISYWTAMRFNSHSQLWQQHPKYSRSTRCCFMLLLISSLQRQACICHRQRLAASPPGCHSLPLARLRLRLAYPLHRGGFHARNLHLALSA